MCQQNHPRCSQSCGNHKITCFVPCVDGEKKHKVWKKNLDEKKNLDKTLRKMVVAGTLPMFWPEPRTEPLTEPSTEPPIKQLKLSGSTIRGVNNFGHRVIFCSHHRGPCQGMRKHMLPSAHCNVLFAPVAAPRNRREILLWLQCARALGSSSCSRVTRSYSKASLYGAREEVRGRHFWHGAKVGASEPPRRVASVQLSRRV